MNKRPLVQVFQRETTRTEEGWFPAVMILEYPTGDIQAYVIHPEQQYVANIMKSQWREHEDV